MDGVDTALQGGQSQLAVDLENADFDEVVELVDALEEVGWALEFDDCPDEEQAGQL